MPLTLLLTHQDRFENPVVEGSTCTVGTLSDTVISVGVFGVPEGASTACWRGKTRSLLAAGVDYSKCTKSYLRFVAAPVLT